MAEPARPGIALRIAVAGNREIAVDSEPGVAARLVDIFSVIDDTISSLPSPRCRSGTAGASLVYARQSPSARLVCGLADGGDQIAAETFLASRGDAVDRSIAAVLPFDIPTFRDRSPVKNVARFEKLLGACRYVFELDGRYVDGDQTSARRARTAAYRAQADVLLRHADLLVAIDDPRAEGKSGGSRETIGRALHLGLPVVYVPAGERWTAVLRSEDDIAEEPPDRDWRAELAAIVRAMVADPRADAESGSGRSSPDERTADAYREYEDRLIQEFFREAAPRSSLRGRLWARFERWFRRGAPPESDVIPPAFQGWKSRAGTLSAEYAGLYRGTFLLGYSLAVVAVCLPVLSQIVPILVGSARDGVPWLIALGVGNLAVVIVIQRLVGRANRERWNDLAVDYRYLAERIRSMSYLAGAGSLRALPVDSRGYAARVSRTTLVDWLFQAMVRHVSLADLAPRRGAGTVIQSDPHAAAVAVRDRWVGNQARYHARNADAMDRMRRHLERAGRVMSIGVIGVVLADLAILCLGGLGTVSEPVNSALLSMNPWLLLLAAALPAAVASLNAIRFQSECARLADRSTQMGRMLIVLKSRADALIAEIERHRTAPEGRRGHAIDVLHLAEDCAKLTVDEVAEWSFVYAKQIVEP